MVVNKLNVNYSGWQIDAEEIKVPASSPYTARTLHNRILKGSVEIWQNSDKTGTTLTEEPYTGTVSASNKFQVDYDGVEDGDVSYRNVILFHNAQAGTTWYVWYKSTGDVYDANDFNAKANKVVGGITDNFAALDTDGDIKDSGKKADDFEPKITPKRTAFNKDFGTAEDTVCEGNDSRLSDARTPLAHSTSHITGGSDVIPLAVAGGASGLMSGSDKQNLADATAKKHTQNTDQYLDLGGANQVSAVDVKDAVTKKHTHINKALLDTYTQTETNLADAVNKKHSQGTDTTLGTMTADINMNSHKVTNLAAPTTSGDAIRQTSNITEANLADAVTKKHKQNTDTALGAMSANINMNYKQLTNLAAPSTSGNAIRQTTKITESNLEKAIFPNVQTAGFSTYTLSADDANSYIIVDADSDVTIYIPATFSFEVGTQIHIIRNKTYNVTISPKSGVTLVSRNNYRKISVRYGVATLVNIGSYAWLLYGDLSA